MTTPYDDPVPPSRQSTFLTTSADATLPQSSVLAVAGGLTLSTSNGVSTLTGVTGYAASNQAASFTAVADNAYFVTATATVTLPTAVGVAGKEIVVVNNGSSATVTLNTTSSQTISGQSSGSLSMATRYMIWKFISDGANWFVVKYTYS